MEFQKLRVRTLNLELSESLNQCIKSGAAFWPDLLVIYTAFI